MELNLTLQDLTLAGLHNFSPEFGTKNQDGIGVSTEDVCADVMLPFRKQRAIEVVETSSADGIEVNSTILLTQSDITLTLGRATFKGCKITVRTDFESGTATLLLATGDKVDDEYPTQEVTLNAKDTVEVISNGERFFEVSISGMQAIHDILNTMYSIDNDGNLTITLPTQDTTQGDTQDTTQDDTTGV